GLRPIHIAAELGYESVVDVLVRQGADIEAPSIGGTPLMIATIMGRDEVVRLLIGNGANMYPINHIGATLMHTAAQEGHEKTVLALVESMGQECINSRDFWGNTPMHLAAFNGHAAVVELLFRLGAGADPTMQDDEGGTPLNRALKSYCLPTIRFLLERVVNINSCDAHGNTPLHLA
ncbi:unnamed protein product, partial [Tuber aestivum]